MDRTYINKALKNKIRHQIVVAVLVVLLAVPLWFAALDPLVREVGSSWTEVQATAVDERITREMRGGRRSRHMEDVRRVTLEFTVDGAQRSATVETDSVQVGGTVTAWVRTNGDDVQVFLERRTGASGWLWFWSIAGILIEAALILGLAASIRTAGRVRALDPAGATPALMFEIGDVKTVPVNDKRKPSHANTKFILNGVARRSSNSALPDGESIVIEFPGSQFPEAEGRALARGSQLAVVQVKQGSDLGAVLLAVRPNGPWWVADLAKKAYSLS